MEIEPIMTKSYIRLNIRNKRILLTACHQIPSRSFNYNGKPLICFRCLGINIGFILAVVVQLILLFLTLLHVNLIYFVVNDRSTSFLLRFLISILLLLPLVIDGSLQLMLNKYESNNKLRLFTGLLGGIGQFYFVFNLGALTRYYLI
ncbi:MAG: hypothetical protein HeimC2_13110 [Candidatus Heimdallarchaeota archaeon LC_2]|nr:MAG: hypothetical protein HeimC2_13110 [Candidatus Heimdallarchaeota archaeon LC_2]